MATVFDRLRNELDHLGDRVHTALEQGKLHIDRTTTLGLRSDAARELGLLAWRQASGEAIDQARYQTLVERLTDLQERLTRLDREMAAVRGEEVSVGLEPAPPTEPAEAEVAAAGSGRPD